MFSKIFLRMSVRLIQSDMLLFFGKINGASFGDTCMKLVQFDSSRDITVVDSFVDFSFRVTKPSCNFMGFMHGGMYPVLADVFTSSHIFGVSAPRMHVSVELATSYSSKAKLGANIVGRSTVLKMGRQLVFTRMDFMDGETVCATVRHTKAFTFE